MLGEEGLPDGLPEDLPGDLQTSLQTGEDLGSVSLLEDLEEASPGPGSRCYVTQRSYSARFMLLG